MNKEIQKIKSLVEQEKIKEKNAKVNFESYLHKMEYDHGLLWGIKFACEEYISVCDSIDDNVQYKIIGTLEEIIKKLNSKDKVRILEFGVIVPIKEEELNEGLELCKALTTAQENQIHYNYEIERRGRVAQW